MFDVYIKNYYTRAGEYITDETLMYSIPMESDEDDCLIDPKVQVEMGKAGSFEFAMYIGHPYYEAIRQMKTIFRIVYDSDTIFRGRVLTIETGHMTGNKKVHCEGDLAFLIDSQMEGIPETSRQKTDALTYIRSLLTNHNTQMANDMADKQFVLGQVPGTYTSSISEPQQVKPDSNYRYGSSSWKDSQSAFNELSDSFGGFWRTRYQNGTVYLDWLDNYYYPEINPQTIEIGQNLIDISSSSEVNNIFTALIPVGSAKSKNLYINGYKTDIHGEGNYILVPQILQVFTDDELNSGFHSKQDYANAIHDYGLIFRTESFSNADTQEKLWQYATDWIKNNYCGGLSSFSIGAVDMHLVGGSSGKFLIGSRVNVVYPDVDKRDTDPEAMIQKVMTVMKATYDLHHPEKNQYTIGIPNAILKKNYGEKKKGGGGGGKKVGSDEEQKETNERFENWNKYGDRLIWDTIIDEVHHSEDYAKYKAAYGDKAAAAIQNAAFVTVGNIANEVPGYESPSSMGQMILNGHTAEIQINGPMNQQTIRAAQEFGEVAKAITIGGLNKMGIEIKQALPYAALNWNEAQFKKFQQSSVAKIEAEDTGSKFSFSKITGQSLTEFGESMKTALIDSTKGQVGGFKFDLASNVETFENVMDGDMLAAIGLNGETKKVTTSADGETTNVEIDGSAEGKMTVGKDQNDDWLVIVNDKVTYKDASGNTHTLEPGFVTAKDLQLAGNNPISSFSTKLAVIDTLVAGKASIGDFEAVNARIDNIDADVVKANTRVASDRLIANTATITNLRVPGTLTVNNLEIRNGDSDSENVTTRAVTGFGEVSPSEGKIIIPYTYWNGRSTESRNINFNIADTQFYKDSVSAIKTAVSSALANASWKQNTSTVINAMLDTANKQLRVISAVANISYPDNEGGAKTQVSIGLGNLDLTTELTNYYNTTWNEGYDKAFSYVSAPGKGESTSFSVGVPKEDRSGGRDLTFNITKGATPAPEGYAAVNLSGTVVGRIPIGDWYTAGVSAGTGTITSIAKSGTATYSKNYKTVYFNVKAEGEKISNIAQEYQVSCDISDSYEKGVEEGAGQFEQATVTPQGTAHASITPIGTPHKLSYEHLYGAGTAATYYTAGTETTYYRGNGGSYVARGSTVEVTPVGTPHKLRYTKLYTDGTTVQWAYVATDTGTTTWYSAGSKKTYYEGNGGSFTARGGSVDVTPISDAVTVTPIGDDQWAYVSSESGTTTWYSAGTAITNLRDPGTADSTTYFKKKSTSTEEGS